MLFVYPSPSFVLFFLYSISMMKTEQSSNHKIVVVSIHIYTFCESGKFLA